MNGRIVIGCFLVAGILLTLPSITARTIDTNIGERKNVLFEKFQILSENYFKMNNKHFLPDHLSTYLENNDVPPLTILGLLWVFLNLFAGLLAFLLLS